MDRPGLWTWLSPNSTGIFLYYPAQVTLPALPKFYLIPFNKAKITSKPAFRKSEERQEGTQGLQAQLHTIHTSRYTFQQCHSFYI